MEEEDKNFQEHTFESQEVSEPSLNEAEIASIDYKEISELEITEEEDPTSQSNKDCSQNRLYIERDIKYSKKVYEFISKHKYWRQSMMAERAQSEDLYRSDNVCKKTWRALRQVVAFKAKQLIDSIPNKSKGDPNLIHEKLTGFLSAFSTTEDPYIYYTLLSCMIFLARKRNYMSILKKITKDKKWIKYMKDQTEYLRNCNENKTRDIEWEQILSHPIFSLAKALFYKERECQDVFFKKSLGCKPQTNDENTKTRMTIIDDYEYFRQKLLQTIEEKFEELC